MVRELATNVVRHARAQRVTVTVEVADEVEVVVTDDGRGLPPVTVRSGLANLADRAERRGGRLTAVAAVSGTEIRWTVPVPHRAWSAGSLAPPVAQFGGEDGRLGPPLEAELGQEMAGVVLHGLLGQAHAPPIWRLVRPSPISRRTVRS